MASTEWKPADLDSSVERTSAPENGSDKKPTDLESDKCAVQEDSKTTDLESDKCTVQGDSKNTKKEQTARAADVASSEAPRREVKRRSTRRSSVEGRRLSRKSKSTLPPFPPQITDQGLFIGRDEILADLDKNFKVDTTKREVNVQIVDGPPGVGKTRLGYEYACKESAKYPGGVYLFSLETRMTFHNSVRGNLANVGLDPTGNAFLDFKRLQSHLLSQPTSLFIYDNANQIKIVEDYLPSNPSLTHVLVLTKRLNIQSKKLRECNVFHLSSLDATSSIQLLLNLGTGSSPVSMKDFQVEKREDYNFACRIVGPDGLRGLPLALVHMAAIQREHKKDLQQLWQMLDADRDHFTVRPTILGQWLRKYKLLGLCKTLEDDLGIKTLDDLGSVNADIISNSSLEEKDQQKLFVAKEDLLSFPTIGPWRVLLDTVCYENPIVQEMLSAASLLPSQDIPLPILYAMAATSQENFEKGMETITSSSLATVTEYQSVKRVTVHPLVQDAVQEFIIGEESKRTACLSHLCKVLLKLLPTVNEVRKNGKLYDSSVKNYSLHLYHLATLVADISSMTSEGREILDLACILSVRTRNPGVARPLCDARLKHAREEGNQEGLCKALAEAGRTHSVQRHTEEATKLFNEATDKLGETPGKRALKWWSEVMNELSEGFRDLQQYDKYESLKEKIRDVLEAADMKNTYYYATALGAIGVCTSRAGEPSQAQEASIEALEVLRQVLPEKHPEIASELARLGSYCRVMGQYPEAEEFLKEALAMRRSCLPTAHPLVAQCLRLLGQLYNDWEKYDMAEKLLAVAWSVISASSNTTNEEAAIVCRVFGACRSHQDRAEEGEKQLRQSVGLLTKLYGSEHEETAEALHDLGWCLWCQGRKEEGEKQLRTALEIKTKKYSPEHPSIAETTHVLGQCVIDRGNQEEASALFTAAVDIRNKCLPPNSRKTANSWFELGRCLWLQDVNSQAEAALRAALRIHDQVLERDDPERAWTLDYLGRCLLDQERPREAKRALSEALGIRKKKLATNDVNRGWNLYYLGMCHKADGEPVEARRLLSESRMILEKTQGYEDEETKMVVDSLLTLKRNATETRMRGDEEPRRWCTIL